MARPFDFDFFVLGAGSAGVRAARVAASHGARVAICEERAFGGTCVNVGCIPKKLLVYGSDVATELEDARSYGWSFGDVRFDFAALADGKDREVARLAGVYRGLLEKAGVTILEGRGRFIDAHTLAVGDHRVTAEHVLVATGGRPRRPDIPGAELGITSDDVFRMRSLPRRIVAIGGGYVALEFAGVFRGFGVETHVVHRGSRLVSHFDHDVGTAVADGMRARGVHVHLEADVVALERRGEAILVRIREGAPLETDLVLLATGRTANVEGLGLEAVGVTLDENLAIVVDDAYRTAVPNVYAVGDVTSRVALTPVALAEATFVATRLFAPDGARPLPVDYDRIPTAVFSQPEVGVVGLSEEEARRRGHEVRVFRAAFRPLKLTLTPRQERAMMKLVVDAETDRVLGCHVVCEGAAEIIQGVAIAIACGATKARFDATIGVHPSAAEELVTMRAPIEPSGR